jgi:hypothetical protein
MFTKNICLGLCFALLSLAAIAQPNTEQPIVDGDDGAKEAAARAEYVTKFHAYNATLNTEIATKKLLHHHIETNRTAAVMPNIGKITQSIDCYFTLDKDGNLTPKKVLILTNDGTINATKEFVFDYLKDGQLSYYNYNANIANPEAEKISFYYGNKQLEYFAKDGLVQPKKEYDDAVFKNGIDILNVAEDYRLMLNTILRVQQK